jgi:hypothetical protein
VLVVSTRRELLYRAGLASAVAVTGFAIAYGNTLDMIVFAIDVPLALIVQRSNVGFDLRSTPEVSVSATFEPRFRTGLRVLPFWFLLVVYLIVGSFFSFFSFTAAAAGGIAFGFAPGDLYRLLSMVRYERRFRLRFVSNVPNRMFDRSRRETFRSAGPR